MLSAGLGERARAQNPLINAVKQCMGWNYTEGMVIDPDDADFHHSIGRILVTQNKLEIAAFAYKQALHRRPNNQVWKQEYQNLRSKLGQDTHVEDGDRKFPATGKKNGDASLAQLENCDRPSVASTEGEVESDGSEMSNSSNTKRRNQLKPLR